MRRIIRIFTVIFLVLFLPGSTKALHIIGGDLSYECLGNNQYQFTMKVYRDCNSVSGAPLDDPANISVFKFNGAGAILERFFEEGLQSRSFIPPDLDNPCLDPPDNICVEEGTYQFTLPLPYHPEGYLIAYQRCCRNTTISNISNPGAAGATYTVTLTDEAQSLCNSSPVFNDFPPIVICAGEPIDFDHSATDPNGDSLAYSFCLPTIGASQSSPAPTQASPPTLNFPHYPTVNFLSPSYTAEFPLGGSPIVMIDPISGMITGTPDEQGQFVVGVCIEEFRNGILLGITRRDFQFNVTPCDPTIIADIREDFEIGPREYVLNSCGNTSILFDNESRQLQYIDGYLWEFEMGPGLPPYTSTATDPLVNFPGIGSYEGTLIVNPNSPQCSDTATIYVNIFPEIYADFAFSYDSCEIGPVIYGDLSYTGSNYFTGWEWNFGDGNISNDQNPIHQFSDAGTFNVTLTVVDSNDCAAQITKPIQWYPESDIRVNLVEDDGCQPFSVTLINNSFPINGYTTEWDLGDGSFSNEASPTHVYENPGVYSLGLTISSPIGCISQQTFPDLITVYEIPTADFSYSPETPTNFAPEVSFMDQSSGASSWQWDFGTGDFSSQSNPTYMFPDTGRHEVQLIVLHPSGCPDTITKIIDVEPRFTYFLPNAFTPNYDDLNDGFRGGGIFYGIEKFEMTIWNRWGEMVFQTNDPNTSWNGRKFNTGEMGKSGVYVYLVEIRGARNKKAEYKGFATLIR